MAEKLEKLTQEDMNAVRSFIRVVNAIQKMEPIIQKCLVAEERLNQVGQEHRKAEGDLEALRGEIEAAHHELAEVKHQVEVAKKVAAADVAQMKEKIRQETDHERTIQQAKLKDEIVKLEGQVKHERALLDSLKEDREKQESAVSKLTEIRDEYRKAIEELRTKLG